MAVIMGGLMIMGLQPGPMLFKEHADFVWGFIGSIWVAKDTVVAEKGATISAKLASLLSKLGMKPMEAGLTIVRAFDQGLVLTPEDSSSISSRTRVISQAPTGVRSAWQRLQMTPSVGAPQAGQMFSLIQRLMLILKYILLFPYY
jgi:hypothetical protein